ncbi:hypothetical protein I4U23_022936 [Adineta vaga]|nr:hypothetical protein I4U23_022936 [Adineta vaga]
MIVLGMCALGVGFTALFFTLYKPNTTTTTTTTSTSTTSVTTTTTTTTTDALCSTTPNTWYTTSTTIPEQCVNYTVDTDATRRFSYTASTSYCDNAWPFSNKTVWIRFQGAAGSMIINTAISTGRCGTTYTGYYAGEYPLTTYN